MFVCFSRCLLCQLHQKLFCPLDVQQPPCVEATERLLTSYMLQVVSSLTLRTIKNTGQYIPKNASQSFLFLFYFYFILSFLTCLNRCWTLTGSTCVAVTIRDLGMVPYIKIFLDEDQYRAPTLSILEQLAEINSEEFMSTAIGALCSSTQQELGLKRDLLQVCTHTIRPAPRSEILSYAVISVYPVVLTRYQTVESVTFLKYYKLVNLFP